MPVFHYNSLSSQGEKTRGTIDAPSENEAKERLRRQAILVTSFSSHSKRHFFQRERPPLQGEALLHFTNQLSELLKASLPLYESLLSLEEQYRTEKFHYLLVALCEQIKGGASLAQALSRFPESFDELYVSMIKAGEAMGALGSVLDKLSELLKKQLKLKKQLVTALLYPAVLLGFSLLVIFTLLVFVIPSLEVIFEGRSVNRFTSLIISLSHFFKGLWMFYLPALLALLFFAWKFLKNKHTRLWLSQKALEIPLLKTLIIMRVLSRFCRTLGALLEGGVSMISAMQFSRKVMNHPVLEAEIESAEKRIIEGSLLSRELKKSKYIPSLVSRLLSVGEESGKTDEMLLKIADLYEEEVEKLLSRFLAILQPAILLLMGLIVGVIMMAVLLPLTDINAFMEGG